MSAMTAIVPEAPLADADKADSWAPLICDAWGSSVRGIIETGRLLAQAKAAIEHGEWGRLCDDLLPFSQRTAQALMQIAAHDRLSNPQFTAHLPPNWATLAALAALDAETFDDAVKANIITPDLQQRQAKRLARGGVDAVKNTVASSGAGAAGSEETGGEETNEDPLDKAEAIIARLMRVAVPVEGLSPEARAMIAAVASCARCSVEALWRVDALRGEERWRANAARRLAIYMLHIECEMSQPEACRPFGIEPSSASYIAKDYEDFREEGSRFERFVERILDTQAALLKEGACE